MFSSMCLSDFRFQPEKKKTMKERLLEKASLHNSFSIVDKIFFLRLKVLDIVKCYAREISQIFVQCELDDLARTCMKLLTELCLLELRISEYAVITQAVISYFFMLIDKLKTRQNDNSKLKIISFFIPIIAFLGKTPNTHLR